MHKPQRIQPTAPPLLPGNPTCMVQLAHHTFSKSWLPEPPQWGKAILDANRTQIYHLNTRLFANLDLYFIQKDIFLPRFFYQEKIKFLNLVQVQ